MDHSHRGIRSILNNPKPTDAVRAEPSGVVVLNGNPYDNLETMAGNLTSQLVTHLRERIATGAIATGEKLPSESELIAEFGVSRTVVREAISRLQAEGLVFTKRGSGSFVLTPPPEITTTPARVASSLQDRLDLLIYRTAIESESAQLAATHRTDAELTVLERELEAFEAKADDPADAVAHDYAFHRGIAKASRNPFLQDALEAWGSSIISMPRKRLSGEDADATLRHAHVAAEHRAILEALAAGDAVAAGAAMRTHLTNSRRRLAAESGA